MITIPNPNRRTEAVRQKMTDAWEMYRRNNNKNPYSIKRDGPADGFVDPKPYWEVGKYATFLTYQGKQWKYYRFPENIDLNRRNRSDAAAQAFLNDMFIELAEILNEDATKTVNDVRREFQMAVIRDQQHSASVVAKSTPRSRDYERRALLKTPRQRFYGYMGVEHLPSTLSLEEKLAPKTLLTRLLDRNQYVRELYRNDERITDSIMAKAGMSSIDVSTVEGKEDYDRITAWHGISDEDYKMSRALVNTSMILPTTGLSLVTERWGEIEFLALGPEEQDGIMYYDPEASVMRWADQLFWPSRDVVGVWIRGQIRSQGVASAILNSKSKAAREQVRMLNRQINESTDSKGRSKSTIEDSEVEDARHREERAQNARVGLTHNFPMLDNVEILVAVRVRPPLINDTPTVDAAFDLEKALKRSKLKPRPLRDRQLLAFQSTFPGSPVRIARAPKQNRTRPELTNVMYPGILSMSGIARNSSKASPTGAIVGYENAPDATPVRADIEDPAVHGGAVGFGVFGQTGSGKTQFMLNFGVQNANLGYQWIMMNPPKTAHTTLAPFFQSDTVGGVVLRLSFDVLESNPGIVDPFGVYAATKPVDRITDVNLSKREREELRRKYTEERATISSLAFSNISRALSMQEQNSSLDDQDVSNTLRQELIDNCRHPDNYCLGDAIFGNNHPSEEHRTQGISNNQVRSLIKKMMSRPFWRGFISMDNVTDSKNTIRGAIEQTSQKEGLSGPPPILIEWDTSMRLPLDASGNLNVDEMDAVLNVQSMFVYSVYLVAKDGMGGLVTFDERHLLANSPEIMTYLDQSQRLLREGNATIMLGSQGISDLDQTEIGGRSLLARMGRSLCLHLGENTTNAEWAKFAKQFGFGDSSDDVPERYKNFLYSARPVKKNGEWSPAYGYYTDAVLGNFSGELRLVYPQEELDAGATDKGGYEKREKKLQEAQNAARNRHLS